MVKAGIIGFGYMGLFHLNRSRAVDGIEIIAAYDCKEEQLKKAESEGLKAFRSAEELLNLQEIDLIIVATPNNSHKQYSIMALEAGKNVLCEKPATMNSAEAKEIAECAKKNKKIFTVHQNRRWDKDYLVLREIAEKKTIGSFTTINSTTYGQRGVCFGWRADPIMGGGMLLDWGVHLIDQILQLYPDNKVSHIYARLESILTPIVDDFFEVKLIFDNGVCANISVGTFALEPYPRWFVFGDRGTLKLDDFSGEIGGMSRIKGNVKGFDSVVGQKNLGPSRTMAHLEPEHLEKIPLPVVDDMTYEFYRNLVNAVDGKEKPWVTMEQIIRLMEIVDKIFESDKEKKSLQVCL